MKDDSVNISNKKNSIFFTDKEEAKSYSLSNQLQKISNSDWCGTGLLLPVMTHTLLYHLQSVTNWYEAGSAHSINITSGIRKEFIIYH